MLFQILLAFIKFLDYKKTLAQEAGVKSTPDQTYFGTFRKDEAAEANNSESESEKCTWSKIFLDFWERRGGRGEEQFQQARGQTQEPPSFECPPRKWLIPGCVMANLTKYARIAALIPLNSKQWITHSLSPKDMSRAIRGALRLPISSTNYVYKVGIKLYCSPRPILWAAQHWWQTWWFPNWRTSVPVAKRSDR